MSCRRVTNDVEDAGNQCKLLADSSGGIHFLFCQKGKGLSKTFLEAPNEVQVLTHIYVKPFYARCRDGYCTLVNCALATQLADFDYGNPPMRMEVLDLVLRSRHTGDHWVRREQWVPKLVITASTRLAECE